MNISEIFGYLITQIPEFNGGENGISFAEFKRAYEYARSKCQSSPDHLELLNKLIFSKISGRTRRLIASRVIVDADELFSALEGAYDLDKSFENLIWDLFTVHDKEGTAKSLYNKIVPLRDSICSTAVQMSDKPDAQKALAEAFERIATTTYLRKLPQNIRTILMAKKFVNLDKIFEEAKQQEKMLKLCESDNKSNRISSSYYKDSKLKPPFVKTKIKNEPVDVKPSTSQIKDEKPIICKHCGKIGHTRDQCYKLKQKSVRLVEQNSESDSENENTQTKDLNLFADSSEGTESD